ncbi:uncharacterized protein LOC114881204 [Osmia bicornis bicornis]|uniref:uncharacterized protein LOC114881204 n=1 Tax=Osmia bicornis bicornis TaxID=1437191 RepID=UPI001EAE8A9C|nr:uncharacterized protein LOC114881204 [Osmia bicornis bicornis]
MCEQVVDYRVCLDPLIEKVTSNLNLNFDNVHYELSTPDDSFFFSDMFFVKITVNQSEGKKETINIVVKKPSQMDHVREVLESDAQFHNEILFYEKYAKGDNELPRCYYTEDKPPLDTVILLENITQRGYKLSHCKFNVPLEYTLAAFRRIARYHAKGYAMKEQHPDQFFDIVSKIWQTRFNQDSTLKGILNTTVTRPVEYLRKTGFEKDFCDKFEEKCQDIFNNVMLKIVEPEEPLATICHGDFTMNNTFFKRENGQLNAMLIDFALMRYGSPIIDLSTFLCLHCTEALDKNLLDNVLKAYHDALIECLKEHGADCEKYSYQAFYEDYKKRGIFGYFIAVFFLSMVMNKATTPPDELMKMTPEESGLILRELGGDEVSEILANMLLKLKEFGCLDDIIS